MPSLDSSGSPVDIGDSVVLSTPGLEGEAEVLLLPIGALRAAASPLLRLEESFEALGVQTIHHVEIRDTREVPAPAGAATRSTASGEPAIELEVDAPPEGWAQAVLSVDEGGVTTWSFPQRLPSGAATRGASRNRYLLPLTVAPSPDSDRGATRGVVGAIGRKILKVIALPLVNRAAGWVGFKAIEAWERSRRPHRLRTFTPDSYAQAGEDLDGSSWEKLAAGRALLFVHGTFSRTQSAFGGMSREAVQELHRLYQGRVFAFDHPSLSRSPGENVEWLREHMPRNIELDIVCHSRGGLVTRGIAGGIPRVGPAARVRRVVFVATPHAGTALADVAYISDLLDVFTNLVSLVPDNGVTDIIEPVLEIVKEVASGVAVQLPGLQAMDPNNATLQSMNASRPATELFGHAVAANYEPSRPARWKSWVADRVVDRIFKKAENDLVVPTRGCHEGAGAGFPTSPEGRRFLLAADTAVSHVGFFERPEVATHLTRWLAAGA